MPVARTPKRKIMFFFVAWWPLLLQPELGLAYGETVDQDLDEIGAGSKRTGVHVLNLLTIGDAEKILLLALRSRRYIEISAQCPRHVVNDFSLAVSDLHSYLRRGGSYGR